jgi:hypothetical protein
MGQINITEIHYEPSTSERLFLLFLFVAVCIILVRMTRLAWHLWSLGRRQEFSNFGNSDVEENAKDALKGLFEREPKLSHGENVLDLGLIETKFVFLWETYYARVQSTKTLAALTVVLSFCVATLGCLNICINLMVEETAAIAAVAGAGREVLTVMAIGYLSLQYSTRSHFGLKEL